MDKKPSTLDRLLITLRLKKPPPKPIAPTPAKPTGRHIPTMHRPSPGSANWMRSTAPSPPQAWPDQGGTMAMHALPPTRSHTPIDGITSGSGGDFGGGGASSTWEPAASSTSIDSCCSDSSTSSSSD